MKINNLLLSMSAIAALASCSQKDIPVLPSNGDGNSKASEAKVSLRLVGDIVSSATKGTRATGMDPATPEEKKLKDLTVFFFTETGSLIGDPIYRNDAGGNLSTAEFTTSIDARKVVVVTNMGSDQTSQTGLFGKTKASTLDALKKVNISSISGLAGKETVTQTPTNLSSTGMAEISMDPNTKKGYATVSVHFLAAKIKSVKIVHTVGKDNGGNRLSYGNLTQFIAGTGGRGNNTKDKWALISKVFLLKAQTNSPVLPATESTWSGFTPSTYAFADGMKKNEGIPFDIETSNWTQGKTAEVVTASYRNEDIPNYILTPENTNEGNAEFTTFKNILKDPWYVFENDNKETPTSLVIQVLHKTEEKTTIPFVPEFLYYNLAFGKGTTPALEAGKAYNVTVNLKVNFKPSASQGAAGGAYDPAVPAEDGKPSAPEEVGKEPSVTVTVEPVDWIMGDEITGDFLPNDPKAGARKIL